MSKNKGLQKFGAFIGLFLTGWFLILILIALFSQTFGSYLLPSIVAVIISLFIIWLLIREIRSLIHFKRQQKLEEAQKIMREEKKLEIPEHYTFGDDGQIVELKKPKAKRSKKPHQR